MSNIDRMCRPLLVVFSGLPGTGKSTISRLLARRLGATWLRIDTIEAALRDAAKLRDGVGRAGYAVAQALAGDGLALGGSVVADGVNPVPESREGWRAVAMRAEARLMEVEVVCSDPAEHRRRVETRHAEIAGHLLPNWNEVLARDYRPWDRPVLVLDSAVRRPEMLVDDVLAAIGRV